MHDKLISLNESDICHAMSNVSFGHLFLSCSYCLSRVLKFDRNGNHLSSFGVDDFQIPHSLALAEDLDILCVADRENMRCVI